MSMMIAGRTSGAAAAVAGDHARGRRHAAADDRRLCRRPVDGCDQCAFRPSSDWRCGPRGVAAGRQARCLRRQLRGRSVRAIHEGAGVGRLRHRDLDVARLHGGGGRAAVRISDPGGVLDTRHDAAGIRRRSDRALSRLRADEPVPLRARRVPARHRAGLRSRVEIFRARRAVVGNAALRLFADLRVHRHGQLCRHRAGRRAGRHRPCLRPGVSVRRPLF